MTFMNYYYTQNNETKGPLPAANLLEAIDSGELNNETKICPVGGTQWHIPTDYPKLFHDGCDVYEVGAELALKSCFIIYSHFATLSLELLDLHESQKATAKETPKEIKGPSKSAEELLASCYEVAIMVSESMPHALAFLVSRCTLREEIRLKTINELKNNKDKCMNIKPTGNR